MYVCMYVGVCGDVSCKVIFKAVYMIVLTVWQIAGMKHCAKETELCFSVRRCGGG